MTKKQSTLPLRVHIEFAGSNWSAFSPDIDGVIAVGDTLSECISEFLIALDFHIEGSRPGEIAEDVLGRRNIAVYASVDETQLGAFRRKNRLSQADLAKRLGVIQARVSEIERNPGKVSFDQLSQYFTAILEAAHIDEPVALNLAA